MCPNCQPHFDCCWEKNIAWHWDEEQESAFKNLKESLKFPPVLRYYDDKSNFIWGNQNVLVESNREILEAILKKPLLDVPARLQRTLFEVLPYNPVVTNQMHLATFDVQVVIPMSTYREQLAVYNNVIFKGTQTLIPVTMKSLVLSQLHYAHIGIQGTKLAKEHVFWDGMTQNVTEYEPLREEEDTPTRSWMYVASDLFELTGKGYLIVADSYSGYFDLHSCFTEHSQRQAWLSCAAPNGEKDQNVTPHQQEVVATSLYQESLFLHCTIWCRRNHQQHLDLPPRVLEPSTATRL
ncbi:hypothetical protein PR048_007072, partial [Dryococelus australis]